MFKAWHASAVRAGELSPRSEQTLRQLDLDHVYAREPADAIARLHAEAVRDPQPDYLFALAELNYQQGRQAEKRGDCAGSICFYYLCAGYAYHYLFDAPPPAPDLPPDLQRAAYRGLDAPTDKPTGPELPAAIFDPRFRMACDLYNTGLAKCIAAAQRVGQLDPRQQLHLPVKHGSDLTLSVVHVGFPWKAEEFGRLLFCSEYEVVGLTNQHRTYGLGVPLIATRAPTPGPPPTSYEPAASFPVTAFFRFEGSLADLGSCFGAGTSTTFPGRSARVELYDPLNVQAVQVKGRTVPLETDLTTPLGYYLAHTGLDNIVDYTGFVWGDHLKGQTGIHMLAPYQPGKIPVVLVHGLLSSPLTWAPVFNDLQADPLLRERYQFWYYFYPTGQPYLLTAAQLRGQLARLRDEVDPQHRDGALDEMVFVGHSMGGLISRLMTVDSGDAFWHLVSEEPFDRIDLKPAAREELQQTFFFKKQDCVSRVIFIATPHHGSKLSPSAIGRLGAHLIRLPRDLMAASQDLAAENPNLPAMLRVRPLPTSVDLLAPRAPALEQLAALPRPPSVHYHSIIGVIPPNRARLENWLTGDSNEPNDGAVPYTSAHLDGTDSELVVPADHSHVHHHPRALLEVRNILLIHYQDVARRHGGRNGIQLIAGPIPQGGTPAQTVPAVPTAGGGR